MASFQLSETFLKEILPQLTDADTIKVLLYIDARNNQQEGENPYLFADQILQSMTLRQWLGGENLEERIRQSLRQAITSNLLFSKKHSSVPGKTLIFLNTQQGQAIWKRLESGLWHPTPSDHTTKDQSPQKNIYQMYEENIGPLTPLLSEDLTAAQEEFPLQWIEDAIRVAVQNNARSWRYVDAVLKSWQKEGKNVKFRRDSETNESEHPKGQFDDFVQH